MEKTLPLLFVLLFFAIGVLGAHDLPSEDEVSKQHSWPAIPSIQQYLSSFKDPLPLPEPHDNYGHQFRPRAWRVEGHSKGCGLFSRVKAFFKGLGFALTDPEGFWKIFFASGKINGHGHGRCFSKMKTAAVDASKRIRNWFYSGMQPSYPATEPSEALQRKAPTISLPCHLNGKLASIVSSLLDNRAPAVSKSCVDNLEEQVKMLTTSAKSHLEGLCSNPAPCEQDFCSLFRHKKNMVVRMVLEKFDFNPLKFAISHATNGGVCSSASQNTEMFNVMFQVAKLGHRFHSFSSGRELFVPRTANARGVCFLQVLHEANKGAKLHIEKVCTQAKCPNLLSLCKMAKDNHALFKFIFMSKFRPWDIAAKLCENGGSCSLSRTVQELGKLERSTEPGAYPQILPSYEKQFTTRNSLPEPKNDIMEFHAPRLLFPGRPYRRGMVFRKSVMITLPADRNMQVHIFRSTEQPEGSFDLVNDRSILRRFEQFHEKMHDMLRQNGLPIFRFQVLEMKPINQILQPAVYKSGHETTSVESGNEPENVELLTTKNSEENMQSSASM